MPKLLNKETGTRERLLRQRTADAGTVEKTYFWNVDVLTDSGAVVSLEFDHDPSDQECLDALPEYRELVATTKPGLEAALDRAYSDWQRWRSIRAEARERGEDGAAVSALQDREDAAWRALFGLIQTWKDA